MESRWPYELVAQELGHQYKPNSAVNIGLPSDSPTLFACRPSMPISASQECFPSTRISAQSLSNAVPLYGIQTPYLPHPQYLLDPQYDSQYLSHPQYFSHTQYSHQPQISQLFPFQPLSLPKLPCMPQPTFLAIESCNVPIDVEAGQQIVQNQSIDIEEQRLKNILFTPHEPSIWLSETPTLKLQSNVNHTPMATVTSTSVVHELTLSGHKRSSLCLETRDRKGKRRRQSNCIQACNSNEIDSHPNNQHVAKRPRKALQLQEKLNIIDYREQNPSTTFKEMEIHFGIPRSTIHGIIKNKQRFNSLVKSQPHSYLKLETSRMVKLRSPVLEVLLGAWIMDLVSQRIPVSDKKITTQAFEIHRMLSGLLVEPQKPCQFSSGWLKNFKRRNHISQTVMHGNDPTLDEIAKAFEDLHCQLAGMDMIWSCDVTHMFLDVIPTSVFKESRQATCGVNLDTASVSLLLCCDSSGYDRRDPLVLVRHSSGVFEFEGYDDMVVDAAVEDLSASVFRDWLREFDSSSSVSPYHNNAILVDEAVWNLLESDSHDFTFTIGRTKVIKVPKALNALMPMGTGAMKELKANYHILLMEARVAGGCSNEVALEDYLRLIPEAWNRVSKSTLECCFERFKPPTMRFSKTSPSHSSNYASLKSICAAVEEKLQVSLKDILPPIPNVVNYYLNQDKDMGPSSFLRAKIQEMKGHESFEQYFGTPFIEKVRIIRRGRLAVTANNREDSKFSPSPPTLTWSESSFKQSSLTWHAPGVGGYSTLSELVSSTNLPVPRTPRKLLKCLQRVSSTSSTSSASVPDES